MSQIVRMATTETLDGRLQWNKLRDFVCLCLGNMIIGMRTTAGPDNFRTIARQ
jgi:hypothetical protein